jgi:hypothetical protein
MFEEMPEPPDGPPEDESAASFPPPEPNSEQDSGDEKNEPEFDPLAELEAAQSALQRAEAVRIVALLNGYRGALDEAVAVFGPSSDDRGGPFARSFLLEAAQVLRMSERGAAHLLDTGAAVRFACPRTWSVFTEGRTTWRAVELVWRQAQGLDPDWLAAYDEVAAQAVERTPLPRLKERLHRLRERLQAGTAKERRRAAEKDRRVEVEPAADGMAYLTLYGPAPDLLAIDEALTRAAVAAHGVEGEQRCIPALRFDTARDLLIAGIAKPSPAGADVRVVRHRGVQPRVHVTVPVLTLLGRSDEPATLSGYGPIDIETARELAAQAPSLIRILTHPVTGVRLAMDRQVYTPPPDLQRWLRVRDEICRAPGCGKAAGLCDIDHVHPWGADGLSNDDNLAHLCRRHHRLKGSGYWRTELDDRGRMLWVSPWARRYVTEPADEPQPVAIRSAGSEGAEESSPF